MTLKLVLETGCMGIRSEIVCSIVLLAALRASSAEPTAAPVDFARDVKTGKHWAYVPPLRPAVPESRAEPGTIRNPIDAFVLARLAQAGMKPAPQAEPAVLLRRVSLDLIGLPPTPR